MFTLSLKISNHNQMLPKSIDKDDKYHDIKTSWHLRTQQTKSDLTIWGRFQLTSSNYLSKMQMHYYIFLQLKSIIFSNILISIHKQRRTLLWQNCNGSMLCNTKSIGRWDRNNQNSETDMIGAHHSSSKNSLQNFTTILSLL